LKPIKPRFFKKLMFNNMLMNTRIPFTTTSQILLLMDSVKIFLLTFQN